MDTVKQLGELALGSRLKRLSDEIMKDGKKIYAANKIDFEPKWFPVYYTISQATSITVTDIADAIGFKHPSVSQLVKELEKNGLIESIASTKDARKRNLKLSKKGRNLLPGIESIWSDISNALNEMINQHTHNILCALEQCEDDFEQTPMLERVQAHRKARLMSQIEIIDYEPKYAKDFLRLNVEWIEKYFKLEDEDRRTLEDPDKYIIKSGGAIKLAKYKDEIVGTSALMKISEEVYELVKMAVTEKCQGLQIGKKLGLSVLEKAKELGAAKVILESNKKLSPAINLYKSLGFKSGQHFGEKSVYERCDIEMEIMI
ncbi:transcriptional regulator, MarR family with acetyltransferase activity [Reichenbachiella faecimaris]|uniref:Transcriptional regulator, MarR family with acetyltransferase activity n=1 Tax=Reichenbachiella faecimaris TaxID=692418 RepID=A0A1W2GQQ0_REIFA|nr:bifunctional helix-turn-helix transcriptional regulator/GNAT family N-acetyltransferase [Reichenbachiella faecimaris]SMD38941.1 transcriptional regulator, MarR family with acetyltransferase activity [Reichenbachiella faecimaris]